MNAWQFTLTWIFRMRWWLLILLAVTLVYTVGAPKDTTLLEWVKDLLKGVIQ